MARWKARVDFLLKCNWTSFSISYHKAKRVKPCCFQERVGHFEPRFQGEGVIPGEYFLVSRKLDTFCYLTEQTAPCYVQSFWHNTSVWQTDGWTDRWTDGNAIASTALAMRALRRAVIKRPFPWWSWISWLPPWYSSSKCLEIKLLWHNHTRFFYGTDALPITQQFHITEGKHHHQSSLLSPK